MALSFNPRTQETDRQDLWEIRQGQLGLHSETLSQTHKHSFSMVDYVSVTVDLNVCV